jgi:hypothetical protein
MNNQKIIDFINSHEDVRIVHNNNQDDIERVLGIGRDGIIFKYHGHYWGIVRWSDVKDYHLQSVLCSEETDEHEILETLELKTNS